ncbi:hypothetical protein SPRG_21467 [Saprolegnia parasitica CBS 223.65]|uniref:1,3-beta-glucan synthase n=1 Tax=Saprolegnia parasitica (strain CBS 223.65) TaxID=695850 RepID=A0A067BNV9_SAPPC|nr:hypothetical protein SPRG_21467 [Saprolegnia parasitica CBS 223.65]KDO19933.1 hypothetical protein SPRG_21467 [Saprolegnia parasitica CBS 223.65]|eukprot:XP_012209383.1 hypothetical protein SPRG_21467 [Saprolegnia parasitica CBS 223.65]
MSSMSPALETQKELYDEAMLHVNAGVAAQSGEDKAAAEKEFATAIEVMERALAMDFSHEEKEASKRLANKMGRYVTMIKSQRGKGDGKGATARYNILDLENLPARYAPVTNALTTSPTHGDVFESLKNIFGFQENNVKNQREHVTLLLTNYKEQLETPLATPLESSKKSKKTEIVAPLLPADAAEATKLAIEKLHMRLFDNYGKWCKYLKQTPAFSKEPLVDIAGNFRQTPELLCFLFHSLLPTATPNSSPKEPGTYLATIIRPIYAEVKKDNDKKTPLGQRAPHKEIRNYDDFNEFFWTTKCLKFDATNIATALGSSTRRGSRKTCPRRSSRRGRGSARSATILGKLYYKPRLSYNMNDDFEVETCNLPKLATCLGVSNYVPYTTFQYLPEDMKMLMADIPFQPCLELLGGRCSCYLETLKDCFSQKGTSVVYDLSDPGAISSIKYNQATCMPAYYKAALDVINNAGNGKLNCATCTFPAADMPTKLPAFLIGLVDFSRADMGPLVFLGGAAVFALFVAGEMVNRLFSGLFIGYVGRNLPVPWSAWCRYSCFWLFMFTVKLLFDYNFMVKNLVETSLMIWLSDPTQYLQVSHFMVQKSYHNIIYIVFLWLPAVIVFFYDCQIFYAMFSVVFGSIRGFNLRIGELRSFRILRQAFKSIPKMFNKKLVPNEAEVEASKAKMEEKKKKVSAKEKEAAEEHALEIKAQLYQGGSALTNISMHKSFGHVSGIDGKEFERVYPFAMAWNRCLSSMREADVINNRELNVLSYLIDGHDTDEARLYPPAFLTAGKLDESLDIISDCAAIYDKLKSDKKKESALDKVEAAMRERLKKDDLRIEACLGSYKFTVRVLKVLLGDAHADMEPCYDFIEEAVHTHAILKGLNVSGLHALRTAASVAMKAIVDAPKAAKSDSLTFQRALYRVIDAVEQLLVQLKKVLSKQEALAKVLNDTPLKPNSFFIAADPTHEYATNQLNALIGDKQTMAIVSRAYQLLTVDNVDAEPRSEEGQRRLRFFSNSLFMEMPDAQSIKKMHSLSVATPYYSEIVLYSMKDLLVTEGKGGETKLLYYLQTVYRDEWEHFLERLGVSNEKDAIAKSPEEVQLWASYRGQTLARTIRGMMYNEEAIRFLYWLELGHHKASEELNKELDEMVALKFNYVVTCQIYGKQKEEDKQQAKDIDYLLKKHPSLRVAYVDGPKKMKEGPPKYFSCLVRASKDEEKVTEVYRIELPGDPIIGEGKPENQNHAVVFSRGELIQCVDMNQDGYFEECLKMPNLLATVDRPEHKNSPLTIIGFREYVFTGAVSNLASFMQIQELSFVSLGQRMLAYNYVRQHYGHPDIFDKMFAMGTGGTAKASRGINLSEDIFAGFNSTLRGGRVSHEEFIQVGKGRDVGMQQLALFEAKLSSGAGECVTSRDVMRMANRLDFFRLNSWFYGNLGWYFTQTMTVFGVYFFIYGKIYFALSGMDAFYLQLGRMGISGVLNTSWALQFGFLLVVPVIGVVGVERGFRHGVTFLFWNVMTLGPLFFTFQMGNRMHYFDRTLIHGGAKYRATGRGFTIKHEKFAELFRFYAFSHFYRGVELMFLLVLFAIYGTFNWCNCSWQQDITFYNGVEPLPYEWQARCYANWYQQCVLPTNQNYGVMSYSLWLIAATWVWSPFIFNPSAFDWDFVIAGYRDWQNWLQTKNDSTESWFGWWSAELEYLEHSTAFSRFVMFVRKTRFLLVAFGLYLQLMYRLFYKDQHTTVAQGNPMLPYILAGASVVFLILFACVAYVASRVTKKMTMKQRKLRKIKFNLSALGFVLLIGSLMYLSVTHLAEVIVILALVLYWFLQYTICRLKQHHVIMVNIAKGFDVVIGWIVFGPILFISMFMPFLAAFQQRVMFNSAFTSGLEVHKLLGNEVANEVTALQPAPAADKPKVKATKKKKTDEPTPTSYGAI